MRQFVQAIEKSFEVHSAQIVPPYLSWIYNVAPSFSINGDQISILHKPDEFYTTLLERCRGAKKRIVLASLYLGTGPLESALVQALDCRLKELGKDLNVNILLDANRGSRGIHNSRTMLLPLLRSHPHCQVAMFHTPALRGLLRHLLPPRYNELIGLQHMKVYVIDDSLIISGANLSQDYFTNRQDRYILISDCPPIADFYYKLVDKVSSVSLKLCSNNILSMSSNVHPYQCSQETYSSHARSEIWGFYMNMVEQSKRTIEAGHDTWIFPLIELPPISVHLDSKVTKRILELADAGSTLHLATPYFNLTDDYNSTILKRSKAQFQFLMAHPTANSFNTASGPAGRIPHAYTSLAAGFLNWARRIGQCHRITLLEYQRPGWTYHAKGLWHTLAGQSSPYLTLIGSSNFGARSVERDLESQVVIVTSNENLSKRLKEEQNHLYELGIQFSEETATQADRKSPLWVKAVLWFFKNYF
uniref:CDP-diacylglycerol--glycerol-3-phosphate 3-phosphatidyltransferase n=2 Tax=Clastoptera arizonana TaxID=38151 RepID=A0A1B6D6J1_9HEMI